MKTNMKNINAKIVIALFLSFLIGAIFGNLITIETSFLPITQKLQILNRADEKITENIDFELFWKTWKKVQEKYVDKDKIDNQKMVYGAIKGMVASLGDPYTIFMDPKETEEFNIDINGTFEGIGAELGIKDGILTVIAPLKDTPAEKAGLKAQDKILKIEDTLSGELTIDEAVRMIRGPKGTAVNLTILHKDESEPKEIVITRDTINIKNVELTFKDNIALLKISRFDNKTTEDVNEAVNQIFANAAKGLAIDLRNNPGGYLDSSIDVAGIFLPKNSLVVIENFGNGKTEKHYSKDNSRLEKMPMTVLINEGTASAAEILAGALRDNRKIKLVGQKTFGKGSVQELLDLNSDSNSSLKITIAHWLTPSGLNINKEGIKPDIEIKMTKEDYENTQDPQLEEAIKLLK